MIPEAEEKYVDAAEVAADLVSTWADLVVAAVRERHGVAAGAYLRAQTDMLRLTLTGLLEESHRVVFQGADLTSVDGVPIELVRAVNEIEAEGDTDGSPNSE